MASGRAIGSGAAKGQATTLELRLEARGARRHKSCVRPMAGLICVRRSVQWNVYRIQAA